MKVKYFRDTDTALFEFADRPVEETREITENVIVDLDKDGNLVNMTIEHAARVASLPGISLEEIGAGAA
ncbi:MAG: DUF2283 domain-containing protein [Gemmatimonadales bacterium]